MQRLPSSVILLIVLAVPVAQAQVSKTPGASPHTPITTITLGADQIGIVKTAQGITTRIVFPEKVTESICGDLYDPASGKGTFVVQNSGSDVFVKPIAAKGMSNLFVIIGDGSNKHIYSFDLNVVKGAQAHRVVNVINAAAAAPAAPAAAEPIVSEAPGEAGGLTLQELPKQIRTASSNLPVFTTSTVRNVDLNPTGEGPEGIIRNHTRPPEAPPPVKVPAKREEPRLEPPIREPKEDAPRIIRKSGGVVSGEATRKTEPRYPSRARAAGISGTVIVEVNVDESGNVVSAQALSGHPLLRDAAVSAAHGWKFNPTKVSGSPVKVVRTITFNFSL